MTHASIASQIVREKAEEVLVQSRKEQTILKKTRKRAAGIMWLRFKKLSALKRWWKTAAITTDHQLDWINCKADDMWFWRRGRRYERVVRKIVQAEKLLMLANKSNNDVVYLDPDDAGFLKIDPSVYE